MKLRRFLSGLLFGVGCAVTFVGVMAFALPKVDNAQLQLVLASFESPSRFALVNMISSAMRFALRESLKVLLFGAICLALGGFLFCRFLEPEKKRVSQPEPAQAPAAAPLFQEEDNPFAVSEAVILPEEYTFAPAAVQPESDIASVMTGHRPLLEENRIEETSPWLPKHFDAEAHAVESEAGTSSPSGSHVILRAPMHLSTPSAEESAASVPPAQELSPPAPSAETEPALPKPPEAPLLKPAPSRIRSTMGKHKQW